MKIVVADWRRALANYLSPPMAPILLNGVISGLPWVALVTMLSLWLRDLGHTLSGIAAFGLILLIYPLNLLWSPIVASVRVPLGAAHGRWRGWILLMQAAMVAATAAVGLWGLTAGGAPPLWAIIALGLCVAAAGATADIAIDAMRIELIPPDDAPLQAAAAGVTTIGWWLGYGGVGALMLWLADSLAAAFPETRWALCYLALAATVALTMPLSMLLPTLPLHGARVAAASAGWRLWWEPVAQFMRRHGLQLGLALLAIIFLFKLGEAFLGRMSLLFYRDIGFSETEIAIYSKGLGTFTYCLFILLGGVVSARYGLLRGVLIGGVLMAVTNLLFAWLALSPTHALFGFAVVADQLTTALSTVAFVAFISQLCDRAHTATQYAALSSLGNLARTTLAASAGLLVERGLGGSWPVFFVVTTLMAAPALLMLVVLRGRLRPVLAG